MNREETRIPYADEETSEAFLADDLIDITRSQSLKAMWDAETPALAKRQVG